MRALIVGAGAVGQVFGHHLARGGAEVTFLVKPKYAEECRRGFTLYPLDRKPPIAERFTGFHVFTTSGDAAGTAWDQIYLTMSSVALTAGDWLAELARATGDAPIVFLQPNLEDRGFVTSVVDPHRLVDGTIGFLSFPTPLPGDTRFTELGMAYWFPRAPSPFSGEHAGGVVAALRRGKLPARRVRDVTAMAPFVAPVLYPYITALEAARWSFDELGRGDHLPLAGRAAAQSIAIVERRLGRRAPWQVRLATRPFMVRMVLRMARSMVPFDLEAYLRVHFTKVGEQVRSGTQSYIAHGRKAGLATDAVEQLAGASAAPAAGHA
jgi:2-dehydropantoate 2-reductase